MIYVATPNPQVALHCENIAKTHATGTEENTVDVLEHDLFVASALNAWIFHKEELDSS